MPRIDVHVQWPRGQRLRCKLNYWVGSLELQCEAVQPAAGKGTVWAAVAQVEGDTWRDRLCGSLLSPTQDATRGQRAMGAGRAAPNPVEAATQRQRRRRAGLPAAARGHRGAPWGSAHWADCAAQGGGGRRPHPRRRAGGRLANERPQSGVADAVHAGVGPLLCVGVQALHRCRRDIQRRCREICPGPEAPAVLPRAGEGGCRSRGDKVDEGIALAFTDLKRAGQVHKVVKVCEARPVQLIAQHLLRRTLRQVPDHDCGNSFFRFRASRFHGWRCDSRRWRWRCRRWITPPSGCQRHRGGACCCRHTRRLPPHRAKLRQGKPVRSGDIGSRSGEEVAAEWLWHRRGGAGQRRKQVDRRPRARLGRWRQRQRRRREARGG
mmetsp:Transcript_44512/g.117817  ORF Transcript_44512/g.117817 Transcript_44512/m.117817 type:complete len:379 (-) Transcript_44512:428-1564(-)